MWLIRAIAEHLNARFNKGEKANSPYISFGADQGYVTAKFGGNSISLDLKGLKVAIASGEVAGVKVHEQQEILKSISESSFPEGVKKYLLNCAKADNEIMIEGIIPKRFIKVQTK